MCGILGCLPKSENSLFDKALRTLAHRGSDDRGIWSLPEISLGHQRLSILDLSKEGHQPMIHHSGRYAIVFNGEIYNFLEIRKELIDLGHRFNSNSDTEVLLAAFIEWGDQCLMKFNGMWAFAIWDCQTKKLFLARDRFGKKPLFYALINGRFVFASEMKAICPFLPEIKPSKEFAWCKQKIFDYESTDICLIEGIKRFPAGSFGYWQDGKLSIIRYWNTLDHLVDVPTSYNKQVAVFRNLFMDACKIRMRSDVPIGTALSGGLDSSATISAMAAISRQGDQDRVSKDWQHAFVACFPGTPLDESYFARRVVENIGIEATYFNIEPLRTIDSLEKDLYLFEELYITSPVPMMQIYRAIKDHGVTVSIDGHGADELFSGYGNSLFHSFFDIGLNIGQIGEVLQTYADLFPSGSSQLSVRDSKLKLYVEFMVRQSAKKILGRDYVSKDAKHNNFKRLDHLSRHMYVLFHETILPTLLRNYDRYSMASGVEIRMPFMDHRLVSYVFSLPWTSKLRSGFTKAILRDAVKELMPTDIAFRKTKIGFNSPIVDWMKGPLREYFLDHVHSKDFLECQLIDARVVAGQIEGVIASDNVPWAQAEKAWTDFTPYLWEKAFIKRNQQ